MVQVPYYSIPIFLHLYSTLLSGYITLKRQTLLTTSAILKSFDKESLYFLLFGSQYVPICVGSSELSLVRGSATWTYSMSESRFFQLNCPHNNLSSFTRLPYLGASLRCGSITLGDMSEWIQDQTVYANKESSVPLQVLVAAWALSNSIPFNYTYKDYVLTVMNTDGDEAEYTVETGERIVDTSTTLEEVDSIPQEESEVTDVDSSAEETMPSEYVPSVLELKQQ